MSLVRNELVNSKDEARRRYNQARDQVNRIKEALQDAIDLEAGAWKALQQASNALDLFDSRKGN